MNKYVLGFTIADARNLKTEDGNPCDPFVLVECCQKKYYTTTKEERSMFVAWNENHIWPDIDLYEDEFESAYIEFSLFARNWFTRNFLIGKASLQLASINKRVNHVYAKKGLYLRQQGETNNTGVINLTVWCLKPGESAPSDSQINSAGADEGEGEGQEDYEDVSKIVLGKLEAQSGQAYHVHVNVFRVEHLAKTGGEFPSPFVTVEFSGACVKTSMASKVEQYTWNEDARIPVRTPVYEDTILIKLWHRRFMGADELLAQGLISFSELRNNALPPRWFCLYGWDPEEVPDVKQISSVGEAINPNYFKGKLLISGRVERVDQEELEPAGLIPAKPSAEPTLLQVALLSDVYEVTGAVGRECQVELSFGRDSRQGEWVTPSTDHKEAAGLQPTNTGMLSAFVAQEDEQEAEQTTLFRFSQAAGRIEPLLIMTPEEPASQPWVMVNVYTRGVLSGKTRVGYQMKRIEEFPKYEVGNPAKPRFMSMEPMPYNTHQRSPASLLIVIERYASDDVTRHNRKNVKPMAYIVRAYVFMGRSIKTGHDTGLLNYGVRVACAGVSKSTDGRPEVRPMWMQPLELKVTLSSDHPKEPPTMEPLVVTLFDKSSLGNKDIGKTVCTYEYMRQKDNMGKWEPFKLRPQWIKLMGGSYGGRTIGEVLVAFELLQFKSREDPELQSREMWPQGEDQYDTKKHFAKLKKATLHFALYGLRDIVPSSAVFGGGEPMVQVRVKKFEKEAQQGKKKTDKYYGLTFNYKDVMEGGERESKWDLMHKWPSDAFGKKDCWNYELFQTQKMNIMVPDKPLLQPFLAVCAFEKPTALETMLDSTKETGTDLGESRQSLAEWFPCNWYDGVKVDQPFEGQKKIIENQILRHRQDMKSKDRFIEVSVGEREKEIHAERKKRLEEAKKGVTKAVELEEEREDAVNSTGLPRQLRPHKKLTNPDGFLKGDREPLVLKPTYRLNMHTKRSFEDREGEALKRKDDDSSHPFVAGKLEECKDKSAFEPDFWFKNRPLLKNHDMLDDDELGIDWNFRHGECFGFVKFAFKLTDGWVEEAANDDETKGHKLKEAVVKPATDEPDDSYKLLQSYGYPSMFCDELDNRIFDKDKFPKHYKGKENVPSRVRVRIYFVSAICIFGKGTSLGDPYLAFQLGKNIVVSMRNMVQYDTNTPTFYRVEERDIDMPVESRLKVDITDFSENPLGGESLIGATVIDLEDRWHSKNWKDADERRRTPKESRPLYNPETKGQNCGSLDMWIELLDSVKASDRKATEISKPKPIEIEVRFIIKTTTKVKIVDGNHTDVKIITALECNEYEGEKLGYPKSQETDTHNGCKDGDAEFNWRVVFPKIVMPTKSCTADIKLMDGNFSSDTYIGGISIDLRKYIDKVAREMDMIYTSADLVVWDTHDTAGDTEEDENVGQIQFDLQVMTQSEAEQKRAGKGREEPNIFPQLVTPTEGRGWGDVLAGIGFDFPDFGLMKKIIPLIIFTLICLVGLKFVGLL